MKHIYYLMALCAMVSIHPYAFVHGSKSDVDKVNIVVMGNGISDAYHLDVKKGNRGRGAEWNWKSIEKKSKGKIKKGSMVSFQIALGTPTATFGRTIYQGQLASDGLFAFVVKRSKDPRTNKDAYTLVPHDASAKSEYKSV